MWAFCRCWGWLLVRLLVGFEGDVLVKWWGVVLVLLGLVGMGAQTAVAQAAPLSAYWQQIDDLQALVTRLEAEPVDVQQTQLAAAASQVVLITTVSLPNGRQIPINHTFLLSELGRQPPDLERLQNILTAWQTARATWPEVQFDDLDPQTLQAILSRPEFQYETAEPSRLQSWYDDLRERFWRWLFGLLPESVSADTAGLVNLLLSIVGVIVLAVVLFYALRGLFGDLAPESALAGDDVLGDEVLTADAALQRAQQFSGEGDYRTAVRYLYLSALLLLEERGLLRYNRSLTNREYLRSLIHQPELAAILRDVIEVFDRTWYGFHALEQTEYEWYVGRVELLKRQRRPRE
ncbi:MAG: DUF4129 domain-containing protein [Ardenticatenaceae bacterium]|nr:DUF4129 domain-containing protein [Ardenticatenaceae bacterium]